MDHLLDRPLREDERLRDGGVVLPLGHLAQDVALPSSELRKRARLPRARLLLDERLDDFRIDHRTPLRDGLNRAHQLLEILDALLQQVRPPLSARVEQGERVPRVRVLAEDDDADLRVRLSQPLRGLDSLVGAARRHADVGEDDVRPFRLDGGEQRVEIATRGRDLNLRMRLEQTADALSDEVVVLREHEADRHRQRIGRSRPRL